MTGRRTLRFSPILLALALAGCGGTKTVTITQTVTTTATRTQPATASMSLRVYFLRDGKVAPVLRVVPKTKAVAAAALDELGTGPSSDEQGSGFSSAFSAQGIAAISSVGGMLSVRPGELSRPALAQLVYTLTQFPGTRTVEVNGKRYSRANFEDLTPAILVELPLPFETVRSPLRAAGSANTFEATFEYDLVDAGGKVLAHHFVTATSGSGTRGTFDVSIPFTVEKSGPGKLVVYETSAENGKRTHVVEIPLTLER